MGGQGGGGGEGEGEEESGRRVRGVGSRRGRKGR